MGFLEIKLFMKYYKVSVSVVAFATVEVEAKNEADAMKLALEAQSIELYIERHTIQPQEIESITEF